MNRIRHTWMVIAVVVFSAVAVMGDLKVPNIIGPNMVLQRDQKLPIWGWADGGEKITVTFAGQKKTIIADIEGKWKVSLDPVAAGGPFTMTISGKESITLKNILVGEVWLCSGQSNMAFRVFQSNDKGKESAAANYPEIRFFTVGHVSKPEPQDNADGKWRVCAPGNAVNTFSAVGYFFGRDLHKELKVPIGLINSSYGGTPAEAWTPFETLKADTDFSPVVSKYEDALKVFPEAKKKYDAQFAKWKEEIQKARKSGKRPTTRPPKRPYGPGFSGAPGGLYNAMIHPLIPFAIRGAIWYQGEYNVGRANQYCKLLSLMIAEWRKRWGQGDFPFGIVQLANYMAVQSDPGEHSSWAELRDAQLKTSRDVNNSGLAVIIDVGEEKSIHPRNKQDVGKRLALWALATVYGKKNVYSGPIYDSEKVEGNKMRVSFKHTGSGLMCKGKELKGFAIAGKDGKFHWAKAEIDGNDVLVWSDQVSIPVTVRYGWANNPVCNLYNKEGLPASPFRTK